MMHGRALAMKSTRLVDVNRYLDATAKLGFSYHLSESTARQQERETYQAEIGKMQFALEAAHEALKESADVITQLTAALKKAQKQTS